MTLISPFAAIPQDAVLGKSIVPDAGQAAASFAQLLDDPKDGNKEAQKTPQHPAYSFAGLGMFGLHANQFAADSPADQSDSGKSSSSNSTQTILDRNLQPQSAPPASAPLITVPFMESEVAIGVQKIGASAISGTAAVFTTVTAGGASVPTKAQTPETSGNSRAMPKSAADDFAKLPESQTRKPVASEVSVTVSGPEEALQIAVRAPDSTSPEVAKLRRMIETTVAHFEMDMAELHFNGVSIDTAFSLGGGMDGGAR